jgi:para-aminobenzoate synthetase/4-amino-4-deoxychorismate lyase
VPASPTTHRCRLLRTPLDWALDAEQAALLVRGDRRPFALIGRWAGGGALVGGEPVRVADPGDDPFALIDDLPELDDGTDGAVGGGWFGTLGFRLGARIERLDAGPPRPQPRPDFDLAYYDHVLHLDAAGDWWFEALATAEREAALEERLLELRARARDPRALRPRPFATGGWRPTPGLDGHARAVDAARERIHAGDLFQANVCLRLDGTLDGDALDLFATAVPALRPDRAAWFGGADGALASLSPELFLERHGRQVRTAPIKGTRPRPQDPAAADAARDALAASPKDRAENTMIVDLARNDLGRVCRPGTVAVPTMAEPRPHTGVWHLVSEVVGELAPGVGDGDLLRAAFPPASVTGAPKIAALATIAELESTGREAYTGAIGFASPLAGLELSVAIRTFETAGRRAWLGVGGGVVADSDPRAEAAECVTKAAPLLAAIGARLAPGVSGSPAPPPRRDGPRPVPRPDPAAGVFETLLVRDGVPVAATEHVVRLRSSVRELYDVVLDLDDTVRRTLDAARTAGDGTARLRMDARPRADGTIALTHTTTPLAARASVALATVALPGGLGAHKWADRRRLDALTAAVAPAQPLLVDLDGLVLEGGWSNVFAVGDDGAITTPPLDGRILPGVTRARTIDRARAAGHVVHEAALTLDALRAARAIFVTGSLGDVESVAALDGVARAPSSFGI